VTLRAIPEGTEVTFTHSRLDSEKPAACMKSVNRLTPMSALLTIQAATSVDTSNPDRALGVGNASPKRVLRNANKIGHAVDVHLVHDMCAMTFNGPGRDSKLMTNNLVGSPGDKLVENIFLSERQQRYQRLRGHHLATSIAGMRAKPQCLLDAFKKLVIVERLFDKIYGAAFYRSDGKRHVAVARHDDDGQPAPAPGKHLLKLQTVHFGHSDIGDQAIAGGNFALQKYLRRCIVVDQIAGRLQ
jgi:hypothetical protein